MHCGHKKASQLRQIQQVENFLKSSVINFNEQDIFTAVESSFRNFFNKQNEFHVRNFSVLNNQQNKVLSTSPSDCKKFMLNFSKHILTGSEEIVRMKDFKFSLQNPNSNVDMACALETIVSKFPQTLSMKFRWKINSMLEKS
jgi:hypothetical protein